MIEIHLCNSGIGWVDDNEIIYLNKELIHWPWLFYKILEHEIEHINIGHSRSRRNYAKNMILDLGSMFTPSLKFHLQSWLFLLLTPSAWTQFQVYDLEYNALFINLLVIYLVMLVTLLFLYPSLFWLFLAFLTLIHAPIGTGLLNSLRRKSL